MARGKRGGRVGVMRCSDFLPQDESRGRRRGGAFTLVELLVVIGVIAVLIGLLLPSLSKARKSSERTRCLSNLHQISVAYQLYLHDSRQRVMRINPLPTETGLVPYRAPSLVEVLNPYLS